MDGFSDQLGALLRRLVGCLAGLGQGEAGRQLLVEHFGRVREALARKYRNMNMAVRSGSRVKREETV